MELKLIDDPGEPENDVPPIKVLRLDALGSDGIPFRVEFDDMTNNVHVGLVYPDDTFENVFSVMPRDVPALCAALRRVHAASVGLKWGARP